MACAVAMPCHAPSMKFKGDSCELVDRLIKACEKKTVSDKIVERDLTPFSFDGCPPPLAAKPGRSPRGSPRSSPPKQHKAARKAEAPSCSSTPSRSSSEVEPHRTPKQAVPNRFSSIEGADELVRVLTGSASPSDSAFLAAKACPGFFSSPRPCEIPMPTSTLLVKATLVKA